MATAGSLEKSIGWLQEPAPAHVETLTLSPFCDSGLAGAAGGWAGVAGAGAGGAGAGWAGAGAGMGANCQRTLLWVPGAMPISLAVTWEICNALFLAHVSPHPLRIGTCLLPWSGKITILPQSSSEKPSVA